MVYNYTLLRLFVKNTNQSQRTVLIQYSISLELICITKNSFQVPRKKNTNSSLALFPQGKTYICFVNQLLYFLDSIRWVVIYYAVSNQTFLRLLYQLFRANHLLLGQPISVNFCQQSLFFQKIPLRIKLRLCFVR